MLGYFLCCDTNLRALKFGGGLLNDGELAIAFLHSTLRCVAHGVAIEVQVIGRLRVHHETKLAGSKV